MRAASAARPAWPGVVLLVGIALVVAVQLACPARSSLPTAGAGYHRAADGQGEITPTQAIPASQAPVVRASDPSHVAGGDDAATLEGSAAAPASPTSSVDPSSRTSSRYLDAAVTESRAPPARA